MSTATEATQRGYVVGYKPYPLETHTHYNVAFDPVPERAIAWETREEANAFCRSVLEGLDIKIAAHDGRLCKNFRVEDRAPNEFVILCDYPA
jgi:hypothetical protein